MTSSTIAAVQTRTANPDQSGDRHLGYLDALRGIAVLGVLLVHTAILTGQSGPAFVIGFSGQRGVQLFYMISAFTLCLSLDSARKERHALINFFIRRFFRIAPLFYIAILANLLLNAWAPVYSSLHRLSRLDILLGFLFLNGTSPKGINSVAIGGWSIAVETTFYLVLPLLHRRFKTVNETLLLFLISAPILGLLSWRLSIRTKADPVLEQYFAFLWFPVEFPVFALGLLTYAIWKQYIQRRDYGLILKREASALLLLISFVLYCSCLPFGDRRLYLSCFLFLTLILSLSLHPWPVLVNSFSRLLGKISYSLYLVHFFVLSFVGWLLSHLNSFPGHPVSRYIEHRLVGFGVTYLLVLGLSIPICVLTWRFIEQPGIRLGRRLISHWEQRESSAKTGELVPPVSDLAVPGNTRDAQF